MIKALIEIGRSVRDLYPMPLVEVVYFPQNKKTRPKVIVVELVSEGSDLLNVSNIYLSDYSPILGKSKSEENLKNERI